tara:strand:+ start:1714 stop:2007 length:294 start_codon:yes stop_codon:yes gene_type:complete
MQEELNELSGMPGGPSLGLTQPKEVNDAINQISAEDKTAAIQSLKEIRAAINQMIAQGASEEEINALLAEMGLSLQDLETAEQMLGLTENTTGISIK